MQIDSYDAIKTFLCWHHYWYYYYYYIKSWRREKEKRRLVAWQLKKGALSIGVWSANEKEVAIIALKEIKAKVLNAKGWERCEGEEKIAKRIGIKKIIVGIKKK